MTDVPQIYLLTPPLIAAAGFVPRLAAVLDAHAVACLRLLPGSPDAEVVGPVADAVREVAHARDVPVVIARTPGLVVRHGLDGVHLESATGVRAARADLGPDRIVGAFCGASRHAGLTAGEAGADYVAFGPVRDTGTGEAVADRDLFAWWSEMIEVPVVAEGAVDLPTVRALAPATDFFGIGAEIWAADDPVAALGAVVAAIG